MYTVEMNQVVLQYIYIKKQQQKHTKLLVKLLLFCMTLPNTTCHFSVYPSFLLIPTERK